ncbi:MAG: phosphoribosylaminoimidazolesuccinocarboxamide synthase [Candidatus Marinimicrobia bacterium]|nr:phosphoribosylaminoimidazolesuccinocarboxamide synthase [Candidatus Neomarinimicrobiota bacterium]
MNSYKEKIIRELNNCLTATNLPYGEKESGKVRDSYELDGRMIFITTDRQSAFDRILTSIPFKGQVLNQTSAWWFEQTKEIIPNHVISVPDLNVTIGIKCDVFPIEFVVRGYITGTTDTSLWTHYNRGVRNYCGNKLPEGLQKNQKLDTNILTPTTKSKEHDRPITPDEILSEGLMTGNDWKLASNAALKLFKFGQEKAKDNNLILVDTKYEFGRNADGNILLVDEIHTPDSSRYWLADSYKERFMKGEEPEYIDKEFLRLWFAENCDPYNDEMLPEAPEELVIELSSRYIFLYETITGQKFPFPDSTRSIQERINENLKDYL